MSDVICNGTQSYNGAIDSDTMICSGKNISGKLKSIHVDYQSQLKVDLSWKSISVESWSQLKVDLSWKLISVESQSQSQYKVRKWESNDLMMFLGFDDRLTD